MDKKYYFLIIIFLLNKNIFAKIYFSIPNNIQLKEVNPNINNKSKTIYKSIDEIPEQYKGKLTYKPDNDGIDNYRKNRFFTSVDFFKDKLTISKFNNSDEDIKNIKDISNYSFPFNINIGFYLTNNIGLEFDYSMLNKSMTFKETFKEIDKLHFDQSLYFFNIFFESNYFILIPFFGFGIAFINNNTVQGFFGTETKEIKEIKLNYNLGYNLFAGFDFCLSKNWCLVFEYKYLASIDTAFLKLDKFLNKKDATSIKFDFKNHIFSIGIKFIW